MKPGLALIVLCFCSFITIAQEFRYYINGSPIGKEGIKNFNKGDLLRVVFINKNNGFLFNIKSVMVTLTPTRDTANNTSVINSTTRFFIENPSEKYTECPSFTFDLLDKLEILKYDYSAITFQVRTLTSNTPMGTKWIEENVSFTEASIKK
ncbi:MAG TPA: hypothetical protein VM888_00665, partial [Chitinophagaceae bacterium]|nr:hypothetical protein [Chitinophagaceae bacterium]